HPVRLLAPGFDFRERAIVVRLLRSDEAVQIEWVITHRRKYRQHIPAPTPHLRPPADGRFRPAILERDAQGVNSFPTSDYTFVDRQAIAFGRVGHVEIVMARTIVECGHRRNWPKSPGNRA